MADDIFSFRSPEEKKLQQKHILIIAGSAAGLLVLIFLGVALWNNRKTSEPAPEPPIAETERPISEIIAELGANTVRDFTEAEAIALTSRFETEWLSRATDEEKGQLYSLQARIFDRALMPAQAAASLELALPFIPEANRLNIYERLYSAHNRAGNFAKAKAYAILVVANTPEEDEFGRMTWQERVDDLTAQGY